MYFGSYPDCEVIDQEAFTAVEAYAIQDGDLIEDPQLYEALTRAEWADNDTVLDGIRYRRVKADDVQSRGADRPQHYAWEEGAAYHYFAYRPIKWRVIETDGPVAILMADRQPDCAPYHTEATDVFWKDCTMRSFLNGYAAEENSAGISFAEHEEDSFYGTAFSEDEKRAIVKSTVTNPDNYYFGTACGPDTQDYVYILDEEEIFSTPQAARHGFAMTDGINNPARRMKPSMYAMARGAWYSPVRQNLGNGFWLLRTSGYTPSNVNYICDYGYVYNRGTYVTCDDAGVVPVIRVDFSLIAPVSAGTVSSNGVIQDDPDETGSDEEGKLPSFTLSEPKVTEDASSSSGLSAVWDCVYFGAYPRSEVVKEAFSAVESYGLSPGDVIEDPGLYEDLENARWTDNETQIDGTRYRRMKADDAQSWAADRPQHYAWEDPDAFHYFRYEPIRWRVIELNDETATLLADEELDCAPFNTLSADVTWENCTLRSFLNGYDASFNAAGISYADKARDSFWGTAFSDEEKACIVNGLLSNTDNLSYDTDCGENTFDKVFILSEEDVYASDAAARHGFYPGNGVDDPARRFSPTLYAIARGTWYSPVTRYQGNGFWFMRTNGYTQSNVSYICDFGYIYGRGTFVDCNDSGILPAIRVDLTRAELTQAGTVSSGTRR